MLTGVIIRSSFARTIITIMNNKRLKNKRIKKVLKNLRRLTK